MQNNQNLAVNTYGNPRSPAILLIHGAAGGSWCYREVIASLPDYFCIVPDLPEHGKSREVKPFTIRDTARRLQSLISDLTPGQKMNIVGLSVGGQIALEMLALKPGNIRTAIISGAQVLPVPGYKLGIYSEFAMRLVYGLGIKPWKNSDFWIRWNMRGSAGISDAFFDDFKKNFQGLTSDSWAHSMAENYRYRIPAGLKIIDPPVLLIGGSKETADVLPSLKVLLQVIPGSRAAVLDDDPNWSAPQQHNWPMNHPELFAETVRTWVEKKQIAEGLRPFDEKIPVNQYRQTR